MKTTIKKLYKEIDRLKRANVVNLCLGAAYATLASSVAIMFVNAHIMEAIVTFMIVFPVLTLIHITYGDL